MNLVNRQSSRQNALLTASKGVDNKNNIYLLKESTISGWPKFQWFGVLKQISCRSYLGLNESLESNIS